MARKRTEKERAAYFRRSYTAVDGLWFMKVEEKLALAALQPDWEVWQVMPKIQTRLIKAALKEGGRLDALFACLEEKLSLEGFQFKINKDIREKEGALKVEILRCPWHDKMVRAGREEPFREGEQAHLPRRELGMGLGVLGDKILSLGFDIMLNSTG
jgi:hypothetical protein